jgi:acetyltransferase-like isoleucine patch superfamily enzyme
LRRAAQIRDNARRQDGAMAMDTEQSLKVKGVADVARASAFRKYRELYYGDMSLGRALLCELLTFLFGGLGGALGLFLRRKLYPLMFARVGRKVVFGRNVVIRHAHRIRIGDQAIIDDNCVLDAKGTDNRGIDIGARVYIGRNTIIYTKNGNLAIGHDVNISSNCQFVSSNDLSIGAHTVIGAYTYLLSGGGYDYRPGAKRFAEQNGFLTSGPLVVGENCWLGAGVVILDAASLGDHCVVAAGAVVTKPVPADTIVGGVPARVIKSTAE